jgi:beta-N-acetylhexosaminidase
LAVSLFLSGESEEAQPCEAHPWIEHFIQTSTLEEQVAQRMLIGLPEGPYLGHMYTTANNAVGEEKTAETETLRYFIQRGVGGLIWFRPQFQDLEVLPDSVEASTLARERVHGIQAMFSQKTPFPWMAIDQEGGRVERLGHTLFPSLPSPYAVAQKEPSFAEEVYTFLAKQLLAMGFNLNFFPTLDVNLQPLNPIIGVRSFGNTPQQVWKYGQIALETHWHQGIMPVIKHFPGHGNGTVDSHEQLPTLHFTEVELQPFKQAIAWSQASMGAPMVMVSHGFYPALQTTPDERSLPASLSPTIIQTLLRQRLGFQGVVITDDLYMGAVLGNFTPEETAFKAIAAGVDVLLYRQATALEKNVLHSVTEAIASGSLSRDAHEASLRRILASKWQQQERLKSLDLSEKADPGSTASTSLTFAEKALTVLRAPVMPELKRLSKKDLSLWVMVPDRNTIPAYQQDGLTSSGMQSILLEKGLQLFQYEEYNPVEPFRFLPENSLPESDQGTPTHLLFITQNPFTQENSARWLEEFTHAYPESQVVLAAIGLPENSYSGSHASTLSHWEVGLFSYRPAMMQALVTWFEQTFVLV